MFEMAVTLLRSEGRLHFDAGMQILHQLFSSKLLLTSKEVLVSFLLINSNLLCLFEFAS